jgi:hypothetical protein
MDLRAQPELQMSDELLGFLADSGLFSIHQFCFLCNTLEMDRLSGAQARFRLELHQWILAHAEAGGLPSYRNHDPRHGAGAA